MYRTDKQFMKDPNTAAARIYVGHLSETVVPDNLDQKFRQYGKVLGMLLQKGFAFIQFENEPQAQAAISAEHGTLFHHKKIIVRQVYEGKNKGGQQNQGMQNQQHQSGPHLGGPHQGGPHQAGPHQGGPHQGGPHQGGPHQGGPHQGGPHQGGPHQGGPHQIGPHQSGSHPGQFGGQPPFGQNQGNIPQQFQQQPPSLMEQPIIKPPELNINKPNEEMVPPPPKGLQIQDKEVMNEKGVNQNNNKRGNKRKHWNNRNNDWKQSGNFGEMPYFEEPNKYQQPMSGFVPPPLMDAPEKNDCEIIVVSKTLTEYAEYIEQRLKSLGLIVDLLFPNEDVPLGRVLANICSRGCLYAMLIMPQNEENRSLTLNILHGIPQEHRNMPIEDAMILITRNFDAYMRGEKFETDGPAVSLTEKHPEAVQMIFNLLAENRQITCLQYDRIIKYLNERRELQRTFEGVESTNQPEVEANSKEAELQNRIMNILNKPNTDSPKPSLITSTTTTTTSGPTPLLNDPSVQKALDSLLSGDMFKSMSATA
ncbi:uncharacterized protein [Onthophagus taurus]|uniref:uncharacterized protein n=1 Tax=Onthophagus taurus TaxID=166361 RepID=UPI000C20A9A3|nr:uncharacterized protein LOC111419469 [Onthophagus taurus]